LSKEDAQTLDIIHFKVSSLWGSNP